MTREQVEELVASASPHDGFHVRESVVGDTHSLHLCFYVDGSPAPLPMRIGGETHAREVWRKRGMTDADYGHKRRLHLLLEALCRYLNTCGSWDELQSAVHHVATATRCGEVRFEIPGFHLIDTAVTSDCAYEHLFASGDSPFAVRWVENNFIDVVALEDVRREQQLSEDDDNNWGNPDEPTTTTTSIGPPADAGPGDGGGGPPLPGRPGDRPAAGDGGAADRALPGPDPGPG